MLLRDYEFWLRARPAQKRSLLDERLEKLRKRLKHPLPDGRGVVVSISKLSIEMGWLRNCIHNQPALLELAREAAKRHGQTVRASRSSVVPHKKHLDRTLSQKFIEEAYYAITRLLRHLVKTRRGLFAPDFLVPAITRVEPDGPVKTPGLDPQERMQIRSKCIVGIRATKRRVLIDGPAAAARGDPCFPAGNIREWAEDDDNVTAYIARHPPGGIISPKRYPAHRALYQALADLGKPKHPYDLGLRLAPGVFDLVPFLLMMGMNEHAPLNLSSLLNLHWDPKNERRHCLQPSPTPGHARIAFRKDRAHMDQVFVDVPHRSDFDLPSLIQTVAETNSRLRARVESPNRESLWLYLGVKGQVLNLRSELANVVIRRFMVVNKITSSDPELGIFFRRLRPMAVADVAMSSGLDKAQRIVSHANPAQTAAYALNPTSTPRLAAAVASAQSKAIASLKSSFAERPARSDVLKLAAELKVQEGAALEVLLGKRDKLFAACIDDMNGAGPAPVGQRCGRYEACLVCPNSVIVERHLPRLVAYQAHWLSMANVMAADAWESEHALNCAIVDDHLTKFDPAVVAAAKKNAEMASPAIAFRRFKQS